MAPRPPRVTASPGAAHRLTPDRWGAYRFLTHPALNPVSSRRSPHAAPPAPHPHVLQTPHNAHPGLCTPEPLSLAPHLDSRHTRRIPSHLHTRRGPRLTPPSCTSTAASITHAFSSHALHTTHTRTPRRLAGPGGPRVLAHFSPQEGSRPP